MSELKRVLSFKVILLITINSIMGTGIFFLPALGAKFAGPASLFSWLILSAISIYIAMCFGELTSMYPKAGGIYEFSKQAYGKLASFLIGWMTLIAGNITIAMLIVGAISYLMPVQNPSLTIFVSIIALLMFNFVAYRGMKVSATMLIAFAFITLGTILALVVPGFFSFNSANLTPFFPYSKFAILLAIFFISETFFGWESSTFLAGEVKDGEKNVPRALVYGTIIISIISFIFVLIMLGNLGWQTLGFSVSPIADLSEVLFGPAGESIFRLLVYLAIIGSVAGWVVSAPRLILAMSSDRLFVPHLGKVHPKYHTPGRAIIFQTIVSIIFVFMGVGSYFTLVHLLIPILFVLYSVVLLTVPILRMKKPDVKRYYNVPFPQLGIPIIILFFLAMLATWFFLTEGAVNVLLLGISLLLLGVPLYFLLEMYYSPRAIRKTNNLLAYFVLLTERISLPKKVRHEILTLLGDIKNKKVLEFGCSVGTLTVLLARNTKPYGLVYASDISEHDLDITKKRIDRENHKHVRVYHDPNHHERVHPKIPKVDAIVSVGTLGYIQDVEKVLKDMSKRLKKGSRVVFIDYDKFFDILPNIEWLSDNIKIKKIFSKAGFKVKVERKQGFAWKYVYVYGEKI